MAVKGEGCSPAREQTQIEQAVLEMILELHPDHLTRAELVLKVASDQDGSEADNIRNAIRDLKCSGLVRYVGEVVAPTHSALRAGTLLR